MGTVRLKSIIRKSTDSFAPGVGAPKLPRCLTTGQDAMKIA